MRYQHGVGLVVPFAQKHIKQLILAVAAIFIASMGLMSLTTSAATPNWMLNDSASIDFSCGGSYVHSVDTASQDVNGNITGTGHYDADTSITWSLTGTVSGDSVNLTVDYDNYDAPAGLYNLTGTVAGDGSASGTSDNNCTSFTMPAGSFTANVTAPTVQPCEEYTDVITTDLSTWDFTQTRATGHYELVDGGLHIWTQGATTTDKVAGYYVASFPLSGLGDETIAESFEYDGTLGIDPGLQLVMDFDGNGTPEGILVGETIYGGTDWWLTDSTVLPSPGTAPQTGGGFGSGRHGTINEWLSIYPDAQVAALGFSLGSGVHGDGVINRITLGCVNYTFDLPPTYTVTINKYIDGTQATATTANNAAFPMVATWQTSNIGSGTGNYVLGPVGHNSANSYEAVTSEMNQGANYTTNEITGGSVVSATCNGTAPFALVGYTTGDTLAAAQAGTPSATVPAFTNLQGNKFVIVWNKTCKYVTNAEQCKNNGWMLGLADGRKFKNQGDCVSYFATKTKNPPRG
jgi:hypothetical protein